MSKNVLVGLSWPYANGELHIGHLGSSLPADVIARFHRLCGNKVMFVSGSDSFGTPISILSQKQKISPIEIANFYHEKFVKAFNQADFQFENYTKTTEPRHIDFAQQFHRDIYSSNYVVNKTISQFYCNSCNRFLADRYVVGLCPFCKNKAKGDSCDHCGKMLEPEILLEPKCSICNETPLLKNTTQVYLKLSENEKNIVNFFEKRKDNWTNNAVNMTQRYIDEGLQDRAITRNLDWGVPAPESNEKDKVIYNWAENVLGYISATKNYCEDNNLNYLDWWKNDNALHYYVHAKDNIPFHTIIFPALLLSNSNCYHLPDIEVASEYVTIEGKKISKSAGTCLTAKELLDEFNVDFVRYYFLKNVNDKKDVDFSFQEFVNITNGEVINNWGNLVNRSLSFVKNKFGGMLQKCDLSQEVKSEIEKTYTSVCEDLMIGRVSNALKTISNLVSYSNKLFDTYAPWSTLKEDEQKAKAQLFDILTLIANISNLLKPFIPTGSSKALNQLNISISGFKPYYYSEDIKLGEVYALYERLDYNSIKEKFEKYI